MIYLSAQPDDYYFLWQLELQIYNFKLNNIPSNSIHILVGYDPNKGLQKDFINLIETYEEINIHPYPDTRQHKKYQPSIRPHIIAKHLAHFPELQEEQIFYHDSDILFKNLPDFDSLSLDDTWYVSDARSYLNAGYIIKAVGEQGLREMSQIIGITVDDVIRNDDNAGGAQYLLKNTNAAFWQKVEEDCERLYHYLDSKSKFSFCSGTQNFTIQAWCTDMWVIWWNALKNKQGFCITNELDFAWADSDLRLLDGFKILHYTGSIQKGNSKLFRKSDYINYSPFYADLRGIDRHSCSYYLKEQIDGYIELQKIRRIELKDVSFLIQVRIDSEDQLENIYAVILFISINFNTKIILTEINENSKIDQLRLPEEVTYYFKKQKGPQLSCANYNNEMIRCCTTDYLVLYEADIIVPVRQVTESVALLRSGKYSAISPYDGDCVQMDPLLKAMFTKILDTALFEDNIYKLKVAQKRPYRGAVFLNRSDYIDAGLDNEHINISRLIDWERIKRLKILGFSVKRIYGKIYKLFTPAELNIDPDLKNEEETAIAEYLKICGLERNDLRGYINSWSWNIKNNFRY